MCSFKDVFLTLPWYHIVNITLLLIVYSYLGYMFYTTEKEAVMKIKNTAYGFQKWAEGLFIVSPYKKFIQKRLKSFYDSQFPWIEVFASKMSYMKYQWLQIGNMFNFVNLKKLLLPFEEKRLGNETKILKKVRFSSHQIVNEYICEKDSIKENCHNFKGSYDFDIVSMKMASVYMADNDLTLSECLGYARCSEMDEEEKFGNSTNEKRLESGNFPVDLGRGGGINGVVFDVCSDVGITDLFKCELEDEMAIGFECVSMNTNVDDNSVREKIKVRKSFRKRFTTWISKRFVCGRPNSD